MSEHTSITGKVDYWHIPYREKGFSYCKKCKKYVSNLIIDFHEGWFNDWMCVRCGKCKKAIWVCSFKMDPRQDCLTPKEELIRLKKMKKEDLDFELEGVRRFIKDDKKCFICKKPTNHYDCHCLMYGGMIKPRMDKYFCSKKCNDIYDKEDAKLRRLKKNEKIHTKKR